MVFVNGCFWHGHEGCRYFVWLKNNAEFWKEKITGNIQRDKRNHHLLEEQGRRVIDICECELKKDTFQETLVSLAKDIRNPNSK